MAPINDDLLTKARAAAAEVAEAENRVEAAKAEYHSAVRQMHLAGASLREIAQALGMSHQRVQQLVEGAGGTWWQRVWKPRRMQGDLSCTFCGRHQDNVAKLIAGPKVYICDACVAQAERSMSGRASASSRIFTMAGEKSRARCSFCGKRQTDGRPLLTASAGNICGECLHVCRQILGNL